MYTANNTGADGPKVNANFTLPLNNDDLKRVGALDFFNVVRELDVQVTVTCSNST